MTALADRLASLAETRAETLAALVHLTEADLDRPVTWRGGALDLRFLVLQVADADDERRALLAGALAGAGRLPGAAHRALADAAELRGRVLGALVGLPDELLDRKPSLEEWPVRAVLQHLLATEQRYTIATHYAALRFTRRQHGEAEGPLRPPDDLLPDRFGAGLALGSLAGVRAELLAGHAAAARTLAVITDDQTTAPTDWLGIELDVRFRLHRFAGHERQHLIHLIKSLRGVGFYQSEAQIILGEAEAARLQLLSLLYGLPDGDGSQPLGADGRSALDVLAESEAEERTLVHGIRAALAG